MKTKIISALILTTLIGATASISNAQFPSTRPANIQMQDGVPSIPGIEFSDEQKEKLKDVHEEASDRMRKVLTTDQQNYVKSAVQMGRNPQDVIKSMNLSRQQKQELEKTRQWQRQQLLGILTNEQKQELMKQMRRRR